MKKILIVPFVIAALGLCASALAQVAGPRSGTPTLGQGAAGGGAMMKMAKMREEIFAKLNLTADQKSKIAAHDKESMEKRREMFKAAKGDPTEMRQKATEMRKENEAFMKGVLTPAQLKQFMQLRREAIKSL